MNKINIYSGKTKSRSTLPRQLLGPANLDLLSQALHVYRDRAHNGLAYAKTRGEVVATKKKVYRQKGTGGARHGARSAPIFVGGGAAHGPKGVKKILSLPRAFRNKASKAALSIKLQENSVAAIKNLSGMSKTKEVATIASVIQKDLAKIGCSTLFVVVDGKISRAFRNIENSKAIGKSSLNAYDLLNHKLIIFDSALIEDKKEAKTKTK